MPRRQWRIYLEDIVHAIEKIQRYSHDMTAEEFNSSDLVIDAVIRNLIVIGEAARQIPPEIETEYKDIPWQKMRGLRNIVVHEYFGIDNNIVWETITNDLPPLSPMLNAILQNKTS